MQDETPRHRLGDWLKDGKEATIALTLMAQLVAGAWWAASIASTVATQEHRLTMIEQIISSPGGALTQISTRTARIEGQLDGISEQLRILNGNTTNGAQRRREAP